MISFIKKTLRWAVRLSLGVVFFLVVVLVYHSQFEPFRERYPEYFTWLPAYDVNEKVTVIEKKEQTTVTESDFVPKLIVNSQNITVTVVSSVSGMVATRSSGFFITNDGVVAVPTSGVSLDKDVHYTIFTLNGELSEATRIGSDSFTEMTFLRIDTKKSETLTMAPEDAFSVGRNILLLGRSSEGNGVVAQSSLLSEWAKTLNIASQVVGLSEKYEGMGKTREGDVVSNGSAVITYQGELLGMTVQRLVGGRAQTIILPIRVLMKSLESVNAGGATFVRPFLGVSYASLTPELAKMYALPITQGAWIKIPGTTATAVLFGSPANNAGIRQGDIVVSVNGSPITLNAPLANQIAEFHPGDTIVLSILRDGAQKDISVVLGKGL